MRLNSSHNLTVVGITSTDDFHPVGEKLLAPLIATSKIFTGLGKDGGASNYTLGKSHEFT